MQIVPKASSLKCSMIALAGGFSKVESGGVWSVYYHETNVRCIFMAHVFQIFVMRQGASTLRCLVRLQEEARSLKLIRFPKTKLKT